LLTKTVQAIKDNDYQELPQDSFDDTVLKHAPKIFKDDCQINWNEPLERVYNHIRGLSPYPAAFTTLQGKLLKIYKAEKEFINHDTEAGNYITDGKTYLKFATSDGYINLKEIQLEGKKRMNIEDFLRGMKL